MRILSMKIKLNALGQHNISELLTNLLSILVKGWITIKDGGW